MQLVSGSNVAASTEADATGNYVLDVPLNDPSLTQTPLLQAYDPISGEVLSSTSVNVSSLVLESLRRRPCYRVRASTPTHQRQTAMIQIATDHSCQNAKLLEPPRRLSH